MLLLINLVNSSLYASINYNFLLFHSNHIRRDLINLNGSILINTKIKTNQVDKSLLILYCLYNFIFMSHNKSLDKLRENFNQSLIFSTEVSSRSRLHEVEDKEPKNLIRISSKFTEDPQIYLKKIRIKKKEANKNYLQALKGSVKVRQNLEKRQKQASTARYEFMKLYQNKKFKMFQDSLLSESRIDQQMNFRLSFNRVKNKKIDQQISISARKQQRMREINQLNHNIRTDRDLFRKTLRSCEDKIKQNIERSVEEVRNNREKFIIRKKHLTQLISTKSRFNYLSKVNEELQSIKNYQRKIELMSEQSQDESVLIPPTSRTSKFANTFTKRFQY